MIAEAGLAALWLAAALALLQLVMGAVALTPGRAEAGALVRPVAVVQGLLILLAFVLLIWLFMISDMSVKLVASHSNSAKPLIYKIAGTWGNHEGSMLLWVTILGVAGAAVAIFERRTSERMMIATLAAQAAIALGFFAFLLFSSNPFERLLPAVMPRVRKIQAPSTQGRIALAKAASTSRVTNAPTANEKATDSPT